ncbi:MAG: lipid-binding SYLF domain-containing protein [Pseudomonadota bacterium]
MNLALGKMYAGVPKSRDLSARARAMLVMPSVLKGGFLLGGAYGEGSLLVNTAGRGYQPPAEAYYSVAAASIGLQAGIQTTSHVLFFMTDQALGSFKSAKGWEVGVDAEVTFPEKGLNAQTNSTVLNEPIIALVFGGDGLLIGASLEGAKYSPLVR